jgi:hypothetical protein
MYRKSGQYTAWLIAALYLFLSASSMWTATASTTTETRESFDVIVAGAGTGGVSAAIQAARMGANVALLEESDTIGGQMAAAGVGNMDEGIGPESTPPSGFYAEYLDRIRAYYKAHVKSIGTCYWQSTSHCFDPVVSRQILTDIIADVNSGKANSSHGHIVLYLHDRVIRVLSTSNTVTGIVTSQHQTFQSKVLIDATEYGDVLPLTPARFRSGHTIGRDTQNQCTQAITWTAVIKKYPQGVPEELQMRHVPPGYDQWLVKFRKSMKKDGNPNNRTLPVNFAIYTGYRGFPDLANPQDYTGDDSPSGKISRTSMNWFNDYDVTTAIFDRSQRQRILCQAKLKTLANLYYIQHDMGETLWSVANDEGFDTDYNRAHSCPEIPAEFKALENNLPQVPYIRESNRLVGLYTLTGGDIRRERDWVISINGFTDAVAVGDYADDLHSCNNNPSLFESDLEHITDLPPGFRFGALQVPLRSFIPESVDGLLAAEKNISQSRLTNGATREQPITMLTGEAAGTLAAMAVAEHKQPRNVSSDDVQIALLQAGDILAREHMNDLTVGSSLWQAAQFAVVHQWISIAKNDSFFRPSLLLSRADGARILVSAFLGKQSDSPAVANTGGFDPPPLTTEQPYSDVQMYDPVFNATANLHASGAAPPCRQAPDRFCPNEPLSIGELLHAVALLSARRYGRVIELNKLRAGITSADDEPAKRGDAAIILYNSVLFQVKGYYSSR